MMLFKGTVLTLVGAVTLSACTTTGDLSAPVNANAEIEAQSKGFVLSACYSVDPAEVTNAQSIIDTQGGEDGVYWLWRPSFSEDQLVKVNALEGADLTLACVKEIKDRCDDLDQVPSTGFVSRAQAAAGRGELEIKCVPRSEQS